MIVNLFAGLNLCIVVIFMMSSNHLILSCAYWVLGYYCIWMIRECNRNIRRWTVWFWMILFFEEQIITNSAGGRCIKITNYSLTLATYLLPLTNYKYSLSRTPTTNPLQPISYHLPPRTYHLQFTTYHLPITNNYYFLSFTTCHFGCANKIQQIPSKNVSLSVLGTGVDGVLQSVLQWTTLHYTALHITVLACVNFLNRSSVAGLFYKTICHLLINWSSHSFSPNLQNTVFYKLKELTRLVSLHIHLQIRRCRFKSNDQALSLQNI